MPPFIAGVLAATLSIRAGMYGSAKSGRSLIIESMSKSPGISMRVFLPSRNTSTYLDCAI